MKTLRGTHYISDSHPELLTDESSLSGGNCQTAAWPEDLSDSSSFLAECSEDRVQVTISGARTGVAGGAVPMGGAVLSTERLTGIETLDEGGIIRVRAGETVASVEEYCEKMLPGLFYPPDPTETTASIGGTVATDASGASGYRYGSTRNWVNRITLVLNSGRTLEITRGDHFFTGGRLNHPVLGKLVLPVLERQPFTKNAAGLHISPGMDLIDLFIGSEGGLGLIFDADLKLLEKPEATATLAVFCDEEQFWGLRADIMASKMPVRELEAMAPPCLDLLGKHTGLPEFPGGPWVLETCIEVPRGEKLDTVLEALDVLLEERGISPMCTWGGFDDGERQRLKEFRHLLPETVNRLIAGLAAKNPDIHKVATDTAVPPAKLQVYHEYIRGVLEDTGMEYIVFGHCGQGHLHSNLIPMNSSDMATAEKAVELMARRAVSLGGTVSAEHGTGKLKKPLLELMYSGKELKGMNLLAEHVSRL